MSLQVLQRKQTRELAFSSYIGSELQSLAYGSSLCLQVYSSIVIPQKATFGSRVVCKPLEST